MPKVSRRNTYFNISGKELSQEHFKGLMRFLRSIGFYVGRDKETEKLYKEKYLEMDLNYLISHNRAGRFDDLQFKTEALEEYDSFKIEFYYGEFYKLRPYWGEYEKYHPNPYENDRRGSMPYLVQKRFDWTLDKLLKYFDGCGYSVLPEEVPKGEAYIIRRYIESRHHPQKQWFSLREELDGQVIEYVNCYGKWSNELDRDKNILRNGDIKYFRDKNGYLAKGRVYYASWGHFYVLLPDGQVTERDRFELFDLKDTDFRGRRKKENFAEVQEYERRKEYLSRCSIKELDKELKRRRKKREGEA